MAVAFDAVGAGAVCSASATTSLSYSHTISAAANTIVVVGIQVWCSAGQTVSTVAATCGGTPMTLAGAATLSSSRGYEALLYLQSPPSGAQTIVVTPSRSGGTWYGTTSSTSYTGCAGGVAGVSTVSTPAASTNNSVTVAGLASGDMGVFAHARQAGVGTSPFSSYNRTSRYDNGDTGATWLLLGDTAATGSVTSTAVMTTSNAAWTAVGMKLLASAAVSRNSAPDLLAMF